MRGQEHARSVGAVAPLLFLGVFEWLAELLSALLGITGVRVGLLAGVLAAVIWAARLAGWMQVAAAWIRMAAVIGGVVGIAVVVGMATGAIAVDVATVVGAVRSLLEAITNV